MEPSNFEINNQAILRYFKQLFLLALLSSYIGCLERQPLKTGLEGRALPTFKLLLPDSTTFFNPADVPEGSPVVLFYFSPRCPYCHAQMEDIINNISSLQNIQFYLLTSFPFEQWGDFSQQYGLNRYPNLVVGYDYNHFFEKYFKTTVVPYLAIYGANRRLKEVYEGKVNVKRIKNSALL